MGISRARKVLSLVGHRKTNPLRSDTRLHAALVARRRGALADAGDLCQSVLRDRPGDPRALHLLGIVAAERGDLDAAARALRQASAAAPRDVDVALSLARVLDARGDSAEAIATLARAGRHAPARADIALAHADALQRAGDAAQALEGYDRILAQDPGHLGALVHSGILLMKLGYAARGAAHLRRAGAQSDDPVILYNLAMAERAIGEFDRALAILDRLLQRQPDHADARAGKALVLHAMGRTDEAYRALAPALGPDAATAAAAVAFAQIAGRMGRLDQARDLLRAMLARQGVEAHDVRQLNFALGRVEDALGRYDDAFAAFRAANAGSHRSYDPQAVERRFAELRNVFTADAWDRMLRSGVTGFAPVLIVGMPRSGTTLVEQILDSHPMVAGGGELPTLQLIADGLESGGRYPEGVAGIAPPELDRLAGQYRDALRQATGRDAAMMTDKMPANLEHLGIAALLLPDARVIHCRRDPRDSGLSCYMQNFRTGNAFADDQAAIGHYAVACHRLMEHWRAVLPLPMIDVDYERLVADPERQVRRLLDFLGLPWDPACLEFHRNRRQVRTASYDQVREPIHSRSAGRWHAYAAHLGPLLDALAPILPPDS